MDRLNHISILFFTSICFSIWVVKNTPINELKIIKKLLFKIVSIVALSTITLGCTEPYALQTNTFEDAIVVEATITNELKNQTVKISRTYKFEDNGPIPEVGANVVVTDDTGTQYSFANQDRIYTSTIPFQAEPNREYQLKITTTNGRVYTSTIQKLSTTSQIENITPIVTTKDGIRGVQVNLNSFDPTATSKYYRFEYEETSKITAPKWKVFKAFVNPDLNGVVGHPYIELFPRTEEARVCYTTEKSITNLLTTTNMFSEDRVSNFPIRFISVTDYTIAERYSILVKQYVLSLEAYTFYKTLNELSGSESILSQNQPGFFSGNIKSEGNPNEKVIGFFDVSSVASQRIFFNFNELFPNEAYPEYIEDCTEVDFNYCFAPPPCEGPVLNSYVSNNLFAYIAHNGDIYTYVRIACGDCTSFSSNIRPSFWID